jgi:hypothetical protein
MILSNSEFIYHPIKTDQLLLTCDEWKDMINRHLHSINQTHLGYRLIQCLSIGARITITNQDPITPIIYPKTRLLERDHVLVVIPATPYFITVLQNDQKYHKQPTIIQIIHELIHCARFLHGIYRPSDEEQATISGIKGRSLTIDGCVLTENAFNQYYGLGCRLNHQSRSIYVLHDFTTHKHRKHFDKQSFYRFGIS